MPTITPDQLQPGDILLCSEDTPLSKLIEQVDQGGYSHTIVYVGKENGKHMIVHATTKGIKHQELSHIMDMVEIDLLDAYRFYGENNNPLGSEGLPVEPVVQNALSYVGGPYFYSELLLGGLVVLGVDQISNSDIQQAAVLLGKVVVHELSKYFKKHTGKEPMVCVQVATTAFWNASDASDRPYGIKIKIDGTRKHVPLLKQNKELNEVKMELVNQFKALEILDVETNVPLANSADSAIIIKAGEPLVSLGTCTLRDMSHSPSLKLIGTLKDTRSAN